MYVPRFCCVPQQAVTKQVESACMTRFHQYIHTVSTVYKVTCWLVVARQVSFTIYHKLKLKNSCQTEDTASYLMLMAKPPTPVSIHMQRKGGEGLGTAWATCDKHSRGHEVFYVGIHDQTVHCFYQSWKDHTWKMEKHQGNFSTVCRSSPPSR